MTTALALHRQTTDPDLPCNKAPGSVSLGTWYFLFTYALSCAWISSSQSSWLTATVCGSAYSFQTTKQRQKHSGKYERSPPSAEYVCVCAWFSHVKCQLTAQSAPLALSASDSWPLPSCPAIRRKTHSTLSDLRVQNLTYQPRKKYRTI